MLTSFPKIKNYKFHNMNFKEIERLRTNIANKKTNVLINEKELYAYLNQLDAKYSWLIKWIQNLEIIGFISFFLFIFINWKLSPLFFIISITLHIYGRNKTRQHILKQCKEDSAYLKFCLVTGLIKLNNS